MNLDDLEAIARAVEPQHYPVPWGHSPEDADPYYVTDAAGYSVACVMWPAHPTTKDDEDRAVASAFAATRHIAAWSPDRALKVVAALRSMRMLLSMATTNFAVLETFAGKPLGPSPVLQEAAAALAAALEGDR